MSEQQAPEQQFSVQRIFLKDLSFEAPQGAKAFQQQWQPQVQQDMNTRVSKLNDESYEVVLTVTITVKSGEETAFLAEVQQAGLFVVKGLDEQQLAQVLNTTCPNILFPYLRETIDSVIVKGTFPALMLPPVNFDALYAQALQQQAAQQEATH